MKKKNSLVITGVTSLFLIFSVLCLLILSLLTLGTSRSDLAMSKQTMEQTTNYYNACSDATTLCTEIETALWGFFNDGADESSFFKKMNTITSDLISWDTHNHQFSLNIPFSDSQSLLVILDVLYPSTDTDTILHIDTWKTIVTGTWNPDTKQHIYQGE